MNMDFISELQHEYFSVPTWMLACACIAILTLLLLLVKRLLLRRLTGLIDKTPLWLDSLLVTSLSLPLSLIILALAMAASRIVLTEMSIAGDKTAGLIHLFSNVLWIFATVLFADRFTRGVISHFAERSPALLSSKGILVGIARGLVLGLGLLVILGSLGVSITPIIASLGITSLAVALALQPTLENFFSGVQLVVDKPFRVGDFIELDSGEQGFVEKIGWRSTWIRMLPNNIVIMPNSLLSQSKIINYYYPEKQLSVPVECGVHYSSDLEEVEEIALDVARKILKEHEFGVDTYEPFVVFTAFDDSSINFTVMIRAQEYYQRFFIKSAFMKALHKRFNQAGIVIPYPIRAINLDQEQAREIIVNASQSNDSNNKA